MGRKQAYYTISSHVLIDQIAKYVLACCWSEEVGPTTDFTCEWAWYPSESEPTGRSQQQFHFLRKKNAWTYKTFQIDLWFWSSRWSLHLVGSGTGSLHSTCKDRKNILGWDGYTCRFMTTRKFALGLKSQKPDHLPLHPSTRCPFVEAKVGADK